MHSLFPHKQKEQRNLNITCVKYPQRTAEETSSENYCLLHPAHTDGPLKLKLQSFICSFSVSWIHSTLGFSGKEWKQG